MDDKEKLVKQAISHFSYGVSHDIFSEPVTTYAKLAIEALEKQIPKMPDMWGDGYSEGEIVMESYECPKCGCIYDFDIDGKLNFCHNCGQAIDWKVIE